MSEHLDKKSWKNEWSKIYPESFQEGSQSSRTSKTIMKHHFKWSWTFRKKFKISTKTYHLEQFWDSLSASSHAWQHMRQHDIFNIFNLYIQDVKMGYPPHAFFRSQKCFFGPRNLSLRQTKSEFWDLRYTKNIEALLLALPNMCCSYCYKTLVLFAAYLLPCFLAFCAFSFFILYHSIAIVIVVKFC